VQALKDIPSTPVFDDNDSDNNGSGYNDGNISDHSLSRRFAEIEAEVHRLLRQLHYLNGWLWPGCSAGVTKTGVTDWESI